MATKKRLIDANVLWDEVDKRKHDNPHTNARVRVNHHKEHDHFLKMIFDAPTVDAVEVVYCQDCARCIKGFCTIRKDSWGATLKVGLHDFCSDAERKK